ncbi:isoleucine--tRNA ligase [Buchnera aphidicola]|uniref:isoleucine--tRNA ligase n=1 Tax=Buchnera aphidicola TaxID=9 RepID=UPI00346498F4
MNHYKNTLNLPKTNFPMRGDLPNKEPKILEKWNQNKIYQIIRNKKKGKKIFLLHDGPPYANGKIHIGHAINKVLKDIIIKSKTLSGFDAPYIPFWDCHGLPIEHKIESKFGKPGEKITKKKFREICKIYATKQVKQQKNDFIRLGIFGEWEKSKLTMDPHLEANVINILGQIIQNKYLYQGFKPVHWCLSCKSALAEAEVEYYDKQSTAITVMFPIENINRLKEIFLTSIEIKNIHIIIWTTTVWTIPANRAIAVHPEYKYQLIQFKENILIIAKSLVKSLMSQINVNSWKILGTTIGKNLENTTCIHPFLKIKIPIILSKHVTLELGTGVVHIAPDYGNDDYDISLKYKIPMTNIIDDEGKYIDNIHPKINKKNILNINQTIIELLNKKNKLLHQTKINHSYPHCWRHKTPIIIKATKQWFINIENSSLKKKSINAIRDVKWIPQWGYNHMKNMVIKRPDWCISRQRTWGVPITILIHKKNGILHPEMNQIIKKIEKKIKKYGSEIWWKLDIKNLIPENHEEYEKSTDILDVWFESGCTQNVKEYQDLNEKNHHMYVEGSDQYRGWFMSSLIISQAIHIPAPYQTVLTHGFAIDKKGQKMSKSLGNIITPNEIIKSFGADILRFWIASNNYTNDIYVNQKTLQQISNQYRKIRNTHRFLLANINDFDPKKNIIKYQDMIILDKWIIGQTYIIQEKIIKLYNNYKFYEIIQKIIKFCSIELGSFYLDIIKDRQYTFQKNSRARRSCQTAMYHIIQSMVKWILPILPFTADEVWNYIPKNNKKYIFIEEWYNLLTPFSKKEIINNKNWSTLILLRAEVNKIIEEKRKKKIIGNSLELTVILYIKEELLNVINLLKNELKFILLVSSTKIKNYKSSPLNIQKNQTIKGLKIDVQKYIGIKCPRCWHYFNFTNLQNQDKNLCNRCDQNLYKKEEERNFV